MSLDRPRVRVVGLGPGDADLLSVRSAELLAHAPHVRLRTRRHPAAAAYDHHESYDDLYDVSDSFESLYERIVVDLVELARSHGEVVYAVPGSPVVAERTVELLRERHDVNVVLEPAVSVIDVACAARGVDPMSVQLRVVDALSGTGDLRGPGPLLILQAYSPEVLAVLCDRLRPETSVTVLHHLALADQEVTTMRASELRTFARADHLTSLWVDEFRDASTALADLVEVARRLRAECPWDQEQTHASLSRHLLEEAYEALDALDALERTGSDGAVEAYDHVREELGDVLFQVVFHAELASEEGYFDLRDVVDRLLDKLISRHPHVFADVVVNSAQEVETKWESLKRAEKGRTSAIDGVVWHQPALTLYATLRRRSRALGNVDSTLDEPVAELAAAVEALREAHSSRANDAQSRTWPEWSRVVDALVRAADEDGVDLEGLARAHALRLRDAIVRREAETKTLEEGE